MPPRKLERRSAAMLDYAVNERRERDFGLEAPTERRIVEVPVDRIVANPHQPRKDFDPEGMRALKESIARHGIVQPIGIKPMDDGRFQLVYGERRLRAARDLGFATVLGLTLAGDIDEIALIENLQRVDLHPFEEADAYAGLIERHGYSHAQVAEVVGTNKTRITRTLGLRRLPDDIRAAYQQAKPTWKQLVAIAALPDVEAQRAAWAALMTAGSSAELIEETESLGEAVPQLKPVKTPAPAPLVTALPTRAARALSRSRDALRVLREKPVTLVDADRELLRDMREAIDAILAQATTTE